MRDLIVGGSTVDAERVSSILTDYATNQSHLVWWYDLGGEGEVTPSDSVSYDDLGRMALLEPSMTGKDAALLLQIGPKAPWDLVPHDAHLVDAVLVNRCGPYDDAMELHEFFASRDGIGDGIASQLLHMKRPWLYPVLDRHVKATYDMFATMVASIAGRGRQNFWESIRLDFLTNTDALIAIRSELGGSADENVRRMQLLPDIRLIDIVAGQLDRAA